MTSWIGSFLFLFLLASATQAGTMPAPKISKTVLVVSDSLSANSRFAYHMRDFFREPGNFCETAKSVSNNVHYYSRVSSSPRHWGDDFGRNKKWLCRQKKIFRINTAPDTTGPKMCKNSKDISIFKKLLNEYEPDVVMIQMGGNSRNFSSDYFQRKIRQMVDTLPDGTECYWVPPSMTAQKYRKKNKRVESDVAQALAEEKRINCRSIESIDAMEVQTTCKRFNAPDGKHHSNCGSKLWGEYVSEKICDMGEI